MILFYVCAQHAGLFFIMLNNEQSVEECDARNDDSSYAAWYMKFITLTVAMLEL